MRLNRCLIFLLLWSCAPPTWALTCSFGVPENSVLFSFGTYIPGQGVDLVATENVPISCETNNVLELAIFNYTLFVDGGLSGDVFNRGLFGPGGTLNYTIEDILGTTVGNGEVGSTGVTQTCVLSVVGIPCLNLFELVGTIPAGQIVTGGSYADDVLLTVEF